MEGVIKMNETKRTIRNPEVAADAKTANYCYLDNETNVVYFSNIEQNLFSIPKYPQNLILPLELKK